MPNSPQSGFILGDPRAAGRDYQVYTGEVYKIWYRPWKSDSPHKLALGQRGWMSLGAASSPGFHRAERWAGNLKAGYWIRAWYDGTLNADILSRRGFSLRAARFLRGRHVFGLKAAPSRERGKFFSHCCLHSRRVHFNSEAKHKDSSRTIWFMCR